MNILLFDHPKIRLSLLPLTYTRPVADLRLGILTLAEKWEYELSSSISFLTQQYLSRRYPPKFDNDNLYINGALLPDQPLVATIKLLKSGEGLQQNGTTLAYRSEAELSPEQLETLNDSFQDYRQEITLIKNTWELFLNNGEQIKADFSRLTQGRSSQPLNDPYTVIYNPSNVFIEEGVSIKAAIINAENGPVYLGKNAEIQEGTIIQGPFAICEQSQLRLGGKMRSNTTVGPFCKIGGEVGNVIFQSNTNKAHEGYLGNSVIGSWCNLGADTNNSNLKNNYSNVRVWNYDRNAFMDTGLQFCGLVMGDHSKSSINTMFNTGTIVGVCTNIHGTGFPNKFVPSFIWGGTTSSVEYDFQKACDTITKVTSRHGHQIDEIEIEVLRAIFDQSFKYRKTII